MKQPFLLLWSFPILLCAAYQAPGGEGEAAAERFAEVTIYSTSGQRRTEHLVPGEWVGAREPWALMCPYWEGRELRFEWEQPRLFVAVDGGPRRLAGLEAHGRDDAALLRDAVAKGVRRLVIWDHGLDLDAVPPLPRDVEVALSTHSGRLAEVPKLADWFPGLVALELRVSGRFRPAVLAGLAKLPRLESLHLTCPAVPWADLLASLTGLRNLKVLFIEQYTELERLGKEPAPAVSLEPLAELPGLECLTLRGGPGMLVSDLRPLSKLDRLAALLLYDCKGLSSLAPIARLSRLRRLQLSTCARITNLSPLADLTHLRVLGLHGATKVDDVGPLAGLTKLRHLNLDGFPAVADLAPLAGMTRLTFLHLNGFGEVKDLAPLAGFRDLEWLGLFGFRNVQDFSPLAGLRKIRTLQLYHCPGLTDLSPLSPLASLDFLVIDGCEKVADLQPLAGLASLRHLGLGGCKKLTSLEPLASLPKLAELGIYRCPKLEDFTPLGGIRNLHQLWIGSCPNLRDLTPVAKALGLRKLMIEQCDNVSDLTPLALLPNLSEISLEGCKKVEDLSPLRPAAKRGARIRVDHRLANQLRALPAETDF